MKISFFHNLAQKKKTIQFQENFVTNMANRCELQMEGKYDDIPCCKGKAHLHLFVIFSHDGIKWKMAVSCRLNIAAISVMFQNFNLVSHIATVIHRSAMEKYLLALQMVCFNRSICWVIISKYLHCLRLSFYSF